MAIHVSKKPVQSELIFLLTGRKVKHLSLSGSSWCWCGAGLQVSGQQWALCLSVRGWCCQPGMTQKSSYWLVWQSITFNGSKRIFLCDLHRVRFLKRTTWHLCGSCPSSSSVRTTGTAWAHQWSELQPAQTTTREESLFLDLGYASFF